MTNGESEEEVRISGTGQISGGEYGRISISGSGTVAGDVIVNEIAVAGSAKFQGNVETQSINVTGSADINGQLEARTVVSRGRLTVEGGLNSNDLKSYGSLTVKKDLSAESIYFAGSSQVQGDVEAEEFTSRGSFEIGGLLSADAMEVWLASENSAGEVGGGSIEITKKGLSLGFNSEKVMDGVETLERGLDRLGDKLGFNLELDEEEISTGITKFGEKINYYITEIGSGKFETPVIEGDELTLDGVRAETVRGSKVTIEEDCIIDRVEYSDMIDVSEGAEVKERVSL